MTTIVELSVDPVGFVLPSFGSNSQADAEIVPVTANKGSVSQLLRCRGTDPGETVAALEADPTVAGATPVSDLDDGVLCRVVWSHVGPLVPYLTDRMDTSIEQASVSDGRWTLRVWFPVHDNISDILRFGIETGVDADLEVKRIYTAADGEQAPIGLSDPQYDAVRLALRSGFYEIPRRATTGDLAAEFDISQQALSERLRRAHRRLASDAISDVESEAGDASANEASTDR